VQTNRSDLSGNDRSANSMRADRGWRKWMMFEVYKKSEALLRGEKNLSELIARGDTLESIFEGMRTE
jgi:hypothetical protein